MLSFFKGKSNNRSTKLEFNCADVYVLTTTIISSYNDGMGCGPRCVTWYFLSTRCQNEYYELFSGKKLKKESDCHSDGYTLKTFNEPYIEKIEPLKDYLRDKNKKTMDSQLLFDFITQMNVEASISSSGRNEDDDLHE